MKISRYIYVPFIMGSAFALINYIILRNTFDEFIWNFVYFALLGFGLLLYNDYRIRKLTSKDNEEAFNVRQKRNIILFANYDKAFDLCLESVNELRKGKIKYSNREQGSIQVKAKMNWQTLGNIINYKVTALTEISTEIEITIEPILRTVMVDNGEGFKTVEALGNFFDKENERVNRKSIEAKMSVPTEFYSEYKNNKVKIN